MMLTILLLTLAYALLGVLLLSLNLRTAWPWPVKATAILLTSVFYGISYFGFQALLGWPAQSALPDSFRLVAADIREPNRKQGEDGEIYVWVTDWKQLDDPPRAYRLPYDGRLHELIEEAGDRARQGMPQVGERVGRTERETGARGGGAGIRFRDQPRRVLPPK